jgi:hypothetical protein
MHPLHTALNMLHVILYQISDECIIIPTLFIGKLKAMGVK